MPPSDLSLSRRLESAEGNACAEFAQARRRLYPASGAEWIECAGAYVVFDGIDSPVTQTFGLGVLGEATHDSLQQMEDFFHRRGAPVSHEVSPFAGVAALRLLCERGYQPIELSNLLYRPLDPVSLETSDRIRVRIADPGELRLWGEVSASGWSHEHPELREFLLEVGTISSVRKQTICYLGEFDGKPGAAAMLCVHEGVALLGGSATIPEFRRHGLHTALLQARMRHALDLGLDLAMMVAEPGSNSQRNAERNSFRIAYTRTKWQLSKG
jgi:GNAT superfamily N-acetyltransferase